MFIDIKIKDIVWYHKPVKIDTDYKSFREGQEISFDIILENNNSSSKTEDVKIEINILVDEIFNNRIVFDVIAVQNYSKICNEYFKFLFVWHFSDHYQIEHMKVINSKLIIPTIEYTDSIVDLIRNTLFINIPIDYNNLNVLDTSNPRSKYHILTSYSKLSTKKKIAAKKKTESQVKSLIKNIKPKIVNSNIINSLNNNPTNENLVNNQSIYDLNHGNITNFTDNVDNNFNQLLI